MKRGRTGRNSRAARSPSRASRQVERKPDGRLDLPHLLDREYGNAPLDQRLRDRGNVVEVGHAPGGQAIALVERDFDGDISDGPGNGRNGDRHPHPIGRIAAQKYHRPLPDGGRKLAPPHLTAPHLPLFPRQHRGKKPGGRLCPGRVLWFSAIAVHVLTIESVSFQSFEPQPACIPDEGGSALGHSADRPIDTHEKLVLDRHLDDFLGPALYHPWPPQRYVESIPHEI